MKKTIFYTLFCIISINTSIIGNNQTNFHRYFWANYNHFSGNISQANDWYKSLFSAHNCVYGYKGYLTLLMDTKQFEKIVTLMPLLQKKFVQDPDVQLIFVHALQKIKKTQLADSLIISLSQSFKTHPDIVLAAAQTYLQRKEPENALLTINGYLNNTPRRPNSFIFYFLKSHIYVQLEQLPSALDNVKKCLELHPHFDKGWLLYASLYEKEGNIKEALSGYTTFLEISGSNRSVEKHLFDLTVKYNSVNEHKQHLVPQTANIDKAIILFKQQRYPQALACINDCIIHAPQNKEYKLFKIQILATMKKFTEAAENLSEWIIEQPSCDIWPKTLSLLSHNGMPSTQIAAIFTSVLAKQPDNAWCNMYCADISLRNGQHDSAKTYLEKALPHITDKILASKVEYQLALIHYEHNNYSAMLTTLEHAYELNQECPHINNNLAYYWATKGKDLAKAHTFIEKALKYDSANPYFLDTQAVILYKEKKYPEAHTILEKLSAHNNSTILLHLAKVHYSLDNKEFADTFTKKAETLVKNNKEKKALEKMKLLLAQK